MGSAMVHLEIKVTNMARAKKFYGKMFGWKFRAMMPEYQVYNPGGDEAGGALSLVKKIAKGEAACPYFGVKSIEKSIAQAKKFKVKVVMPKMEIGGGHGFMAQIKDSEGNLIGLWNMK